MSVSNRIRVVVAAPDVDNGDPFGQRFEDPNDVESLEVALH